MESNNLKRNYLLINTKGHCFFCLKIIISEGNCTQSINNLCRYLNFKVENSIPVGISNIKVNLCVECNKMVSKISELFQFLEVIKMELDYWVESAFQTISRSKEDNKWKRPFQEDMRNAKEDLELTNKLRMMLLNKCYKKCESRRPTVLLERLKFPAREPVAPALSDTNGVGIKRTKKSCILTTDDIKKLEENLISFPKSSNVQCRLCEKVFKKRLTFERHFQSYHLKIKYKCDFCGKAVGQKMSYYKHLKFICRARSGLDKPSDYSKTWRKAAVAERVEEKSHTVPRTPLYGARLALLSKADYNLMNENAIKISESKSVQCRKCKKVFSRRRNFEHHFESYHLQIKYKCDLCGKPVGQKTSYYRHRKICQVKYDNDRRNKRVEKVWRYKAVAEQLDVGEELPLPIVPTKTVYKGRHALLSKIDNKHLRENMVDIPGSKTVRCKQCQNIFSAKSAFETHFKSIHLKIKYECEFCGVRLNAGPQFCVHWKNCVSKYYSNGHHINLKSEKLLCKYCSVEFKYVADFYKHIKLCSKETTCVETASVPEVDPVASTLPVKIEADISIRKPSPQEQLKDNLISIAGSKKVRCKICRAVFICRQSFKCHFDSVHLGESAKGKIGENINRIESSNNDCAGDFNTLANKSEIAEVNCIKDEIDIKLF